VEGGINVVPSVLSNDNDGWRGEKGDVSGLSLATAVDIMVTSLAWLAPFAPFAAGGAQRRHASLRSER
jgi:hypothetical protein